MQLPCINGTAPSQILENHQLARRHLQHAIETLSNCWPHGRDYQTLPDPQRALRTATDEHSNRILKLRQLMIELEIIILNELIGDGKLPARAIP